MIKYESKTFSQNGEDGIISHIFDVIGTTDKIAVELGVSAGGGLENNTRLLADKEWKTFWFDSVDCDTVPPNCSFLKEFLTKDNICSCFEQQEIPKEFDLLSIDIDSNDYYLRDKLCEYSPRVYIMEYNGCYAKDADYIMSYNEDYQWSKGNTEFGASLLSYTKQANSLGYDLVYCDTQGVNAFFIRQDINKFPPLTSSEAWIKLCWYRGDELQPHKEKK